MNKLLDKLEGPIVYITYLTAIGLSVFLVWLLLEPYIPAWVFRGIFVACIIALWRDLPHILAAMWAHMTGRAN